MQHKHSPKPLIRRPCGPVNSFFKKNACAHAKLPLLRSFSLDFRIPPPIKKRKRPLPLVIETFPSLSAPVLISHPRYLGGYS